MSECRCCQFHCQPLLYTLNSLVKTAGDSFCHNVIMKEHQANICHYTNVLVFYLYTFSPCIRFCNHSALYRILQCTNILLTGGPAGPGGPGRPWRNQARICYHGRDHNAKLSWIDKLKNRSPINNVYLELAMALISRKSHIVYILITSLV